MKKQLTILILLFFNCPFAWCQDRYIKTITPCNNELLLKTHGRWMPIGRGFYAKITKPQEQEILNRLAAIHQMAFNIYPEPMAFDAVTSFFTGDQAFASQLKLETAKYGVSDSYVSGTPTVSYGYTVKFCNYFCGRDSYEIIKGAGCETGTNVVVTTNSLDPLFFPLYLDDFYAEIMRIDGRPIKMLGVLREKKWKNYDLYSPESGSGVNMVLFHRDGMLPYISVTRKQYLDRSTECLEI